VGDGDLVRSWAARHPDVAIAELSARARTEARAVAYLRALGHPERIGAIVGDVLALLEACALRLFETRVILWPPASSGPLRLIGARQGDDWGLAIERIEGTRPSGIAAAHVVTYAYGSRVRSAVAGAGVSTRPLADFAAADLEARLGEPHLALAALELSAAATVVAVVPYVERPNAPRESPVFERIAAAIEHGAA
jgi:hypothetical protein